MALEGTWAQGIRASPLLWPHSRIQSPFTSGHYGFWGACSRRANRKTKQRRKPQFRTVSSDGKVQNVAFYCISDLA